MLLLAVVGFRLFPGNDVTVLDDGQTYRVSTTFDLRDEALAAAALGLGPGDRVVHGTGGRHTSLAIQRARPISVDVDGQTILVHTQTTTISGALAEAGVDLRPGDRVYLDGRLATVRGPLFSSSFASRTAPGASAASSPDGAEIAVVRARPVTVVVDTVRVETQSAAESVQELLTELGMTVRDGDLVQPSLSAPMTAGLTVRLAKARTVALKLDGKDQLLYTQAGTVGEVLEELGITMGPDDRVQPAADTAITNGISVVIALTRQVVEEEQEAIGPGTVYETDPNLAAGTVKVVEGSPGVRVNRWLVTYENGEAVRRERAGDSVITQQPVATRQITGTRPVPQSRPTLNAPGVSPGTSYKRQMSVVATWYNAEGGAWATDDPNYGRTFTGAMLDYGVCATDPTVIPMYTRFYVPGYGNCVALDTGSGVKGNHIDLGFPGSVRSNWGVQDVVITILD